MSEFFRNISWKELFLPVLVDLKSINDETDTNQVSVNNWELANDNEEYNKVIEKIKDARGSEENHNIIIME